MLKRFFTCQLTTALLIGAGLVGCSTFTKPSSSEAEAARVIDRIRTQVAPDLHLAIYRLGVEWRGAALVLTGDVQNASAKVQTIEQLAAAGIRVKDAVEVLPQSDLGDKTWAIAALSVCDGRESPEHKAELGTQLLMGETLRVWKRLQKGHLAWLLTQSKDGYIAWQAEGNVVQCTEQEARDWEQGPLAIVTAFDTAILSVPDPSAQPIADAVLLNKLKPLERTGAWTRVQLPDGRSGFVPSKDIEEYAVWRTSRSPTPENIEKTARSLLGRPYHWGANSPRGLDCSGFTKIVFASNGIDLMRNAGHQAGQGTAVPLDSDYAHLRKGDLLFFGRSVAAGQRERVSHTGIYIGGKEFIHSAETVHISSLDPEAPNRDDYYLRHLLKARRLVPD